MLTEYTRCGTVNYSRNPEAERGLTEFEYQSIHLPTGKKFGYKIWCWNIKEFLSLLDRWNWRSDDWKYHSQ
jgi:hypothetical protein